MLYFFWLLIYKYFECRSTRVKFIVKTQTILIGPILLVNKRHATWENQQQLDLTEWPSHRHWIKLSWGSIYVSTKKFLIFQCALARASQICLVLTLIIAQSFQYQKRILLILFRRGKFSCLCFSLYHSGCDFVHPPANVASSASVTSMNHSSREACIENNLRTWSSARRIVKVIERRAHW